MLDVSSLKDTVIEFRSTTCGICRKMKPIVDKLFNNSDIEFLELNVDEDDDSMELAETIGVSTLPTFVHIVDGEYVGKATGFHQPLELKKLLVLL